MLLNLDVLKILERSNPLLINDLEKHAQFIEETVNDSRFLVIGAGGSIGSAVCKEIFKRNAKTLHAIDLNENGLAELVRDIRSSFGYKTEDFDTFSLDCGSLLFKHFLEESGPYDYILNLSAMKHVLRSESNIFNISRMVKTNILNAIENYSQACSMDAAKYFCVSSDKAANPANLMGATKKAMEICLMREYTDIPISSAALQMLLSQMVLY